MGRGFLPLFSASLVRPAGGPSLPAVCLCLGGRLVAVNKKHQDSARPWPTWRVGQVFPPPTPPTPALLALQDYSLGDSVGDPGDRRERSSGLQILNQGQSEEKSEGLRGRGQSPRESPRPAQGTRGSGWGRGWRAQSSLEEHLPQEGLNNETPQLLTEPLSEGCL